MAELTVRVSLACLALPLLASAADRTYVGSKNCFGCHQSIYRSFVKTDMGRSMRSAAAFSQTNVPVETSVPLAGSNRLLRVFRDDTGWHQSESEPNVFNDQHKLEYVVGSGANGLSFVVRRGDYLFQAPLSFYSKPGKWDLSPGYEQADLGFSRPIAAQCLLCHSGRPQPVKNRNGLYLDPPLEELAIGCENCHGPGSAHIANPRERASIVNPGKLAPRLAEDICMNCHQTGDARILQPGKDYQDFRPGQRLIETVAIFRVNPALQQEKDSDLLEHHSAMKMSRCFRESAGKLSCLTCHDPHIQPLPGDMASTFRSKCITCHTDRSCRLPLSSRKATTPPDDCIGCHMPKRNIAIISHSALTNHRIPARPDEPMPKSTPAEMGDLIVVNEASGSKTQVPDIALLRAYAELAPRFPIFEKRYVALLDQLAQTQSEDPYVQAALGHKALAEGKNSEALAHLEKGLKLGQATVDQDIAQALVNLGRPEEAIAHYRAAAEIDPYNAGLLKTLTLQLINLHRYPEAQAEMQRYVQTFPEDSFMRNLLARVSR
jgi:Tetratricopeptide repeat/Doubled CXXCH motif (Paired_CXXCH_1)